MTIEQDYEYCRQIIKHHSKTFYYGFSTLPREEANAVYAIYTFCRTADDLVDRPGTAADKEAALEKLMQDIDCFEKGQHRDTAMWRALADVRERFPLDIAMLRKQVAGQQMDIAFRQPDTLEALYLYSSHVAGSVGELLYPILAGEDTREGRQAADSLGIAMQLTNILRDIGEDYREHQRIYIPAELMQHYGYTQEQIQHHEITTAFTALWESLAEDAEARYEAFYPLITTYKRTCRKPLLTAAMVYAEILEEVRKHHYDCLTQRNKVSLMNKNRISQRAVRYLKEVEA
ncbi:phytoene/squalene synthase family protein [Macrococcus brunensis]|uniref:4,4'-diapophytoene synthase n=1 Tax=Macrococcus brunensis TaxID=198483 RepID=A0A4R6BEY9_9STAP|nr:phytoene/squalene synthase family protein [Macrococcus brunensis]TDL98397.1 phytoene/squalene synthase family protein [Macrococcus brunensis]ULG72061.1 phytoene/squalene synthase family protein [Macrococcus brunensis]ULG74314.1 phytoene/squalene synthase family protein [Macrococcus brunensis]